MRGGTAGGALLVAAAALASCGPPESPRALPSSPPATPAPESASDADAPASPPPPSAPAGPPVPSTMDVKLREIGLDPAALPPLDELDPKTLRDVMNTFTRALGVQCRHCHAKDFGAPTENKRIATRMWNDFARGLRLRREGTLYCDSCHQGSTRMLDRAHGEGLAEWMRTSYVDPLTRVDGREHGCATCHGEPFEGAIFAARWK